jgi:hypothetical protein
MTAADKIVALQSGSEDESAFIERCRREYEDDKNRDSVDRQEAMDDHAFVYSSDASVRNEGGAGSQWSAEAWSARKAQKRPILQENRMLGFLQHVNNMGRQNDFKIQVTQADNGDEQTTEYFADRVRQIEYESDASTVYGLARENQLSSGRGHYKVGTRYRKGTFQQVPVLEEIPDQFSILWGPHREFDCSDAERCWEIYNITKEQYKREYPRTKISETEFDPSVCPPDWVGLGPEGNLVQIVKKWQKEFYKETVYMLADRVGGVRESDLEDGDLERLIAAGALAMDVKRDKRGKPILDNDGNPQPEPITREEDCCRVMIYTIDGVQILDTEEFIIDEIGIITQWGLSAIVDGRQRHYSLGNRAKDSQRLVNLYVSTLAYQIGSQSKAKIKAPIGSIEPQHANDWAGKTDAAVLYFQAYDEEGKPLEIPQEIQAEPPIQAIVHGYLQAIDAMKAEFGIYDASLGARSNETSKIAIEARQEQGELANYHFVSNEGKARKRCGQLLVKMIQALDRPKEGQALQRTVRGIDNVTRSVTVKHPNAPIEADYAYTDAELGINVDMGPSYKSAMDQVNQLDAKMIQFLPPEAALALVPQLMETQNAPNKAVRVQIAKNLVNKMLPGVLPPEEGEEAAIPPQAQQVITQLQQELQAAHQFAQQQFEENKAKTAELETKLKIAEMDNTTRIKVAEISAGVKVHDTQVKAAVDIHKENSIDNRELLAHDVERIKTHEQREHASEDRDLARAAAVEDREVAREDAKDAREAEKEAAA